MKFEYNADLDYDKRVTKVTYEIKKAYPLIDIEAARSAASMCMPLDDKPTNEDKFLRYYYILYYLEPRDLEYRHVFNDLYDLFSEGIDNEKYNNCVREIMRYMLMERENFPLINEE